MTFVNKLLDALKHAQTQQQRLLLLLSGDAAFCTNSAQQLLAQYSNHVWLGQHPYAPEYALPHAHAKHFLGQDLTALVFDAHAGFDCDAFGAVSGALCAGGLCILLTPALSHWADLPDPENKRLAVHPFNAEDITRHYLQRLIKIIRNSRDALLIEQSASSASDFNRHAQQPAKLLATHTRLEPSAAALREQDTAITAIHHVLGGHRNRPLVLTADRGRGKSAALGIAAAQIMQQCIAINRSLLIVLTAPRRSAVDTVFKHAAQMLPKAIQTKTALTVESHNNAAILRFIAPDELAQQTPQADLVLIDEAAAIHLNLLASILKHYRRLVFSSTVHGYEGAGRGFALRFKKLLEKYAPQWRSHELTHPVRWADNDALETFTQRALLLDADIAAFNKDFSVNTTVSIDFRTDFIDRDELSKDESLLRAVYGLLVQAHYQTRPLDLRHLLDGPNLQIALVRAQDTPVAVALLAQEGQFDAPLALEVARGNRRPKGHVLAQLLSYYHHIPALAQLRFARVVRIAVHPALQQQGIGSQLIATLLDHSQQQGSDIFGTVFSASTELVQFWHKASLTPVHIGLHRDAASGTHAITLAKALTPRAEQMLLKIQNNFQRQLPHLLADALRHLDADIVMHALQRDLNITLSSAECTILQQFAHQQRPSELVLAELVKLALTHDLSALTPIRRTVLICKVLQKRSWAECTQISALSGRKEVENIIRQAVAQLLHKSS